ncbi:MAG: phenylalanine--tRNA ligase subunit beta [Armatimonadetes bacterium]|nr:phenylalanine--tRNA ligase subunit beta [Armatimonadota bacterium]
MRVPFSWLKDYVEINISPENLAEKLTMGGLAVDRLEYVSQGVSGVVVGGILSIEKHPNADRLRIAQVDVGERVQIVTGAPNVQTGDKIPVALEGAVLANGMVIKKSVLRGEPSQGMMCSAKELGISGENLPPEQREGVMVLAPDAVPGQAVNRLLNLDEAVLILEVTANRPDCLSMIGVSREVAAMTGAALRLPIPFVKELPHATPAAGAIRVTVRDPDLCPRYCARVVEQVQIRESPAWMVSRLEAAGVRSVNNVVDATNYVMLEYGQPLHAFDLELIRGRQIVIRRAQKGEIMTTIDGVKRTMDETVLVIADEERPVAVGGVMGGLDSEISAETRVILLESANFNPASIRRTSLKLGLRTESSRRFEKGLDYHQVGPALDRVAQLLVEFGGAASSGVVEDSQPPPPVVKVAFRPSRACKVLGLEIPEPLQESYLHALGLDIIVEGNGARTVSVPTFRNDLREEIDLIEEIARLHGYQTIPETLPRDTTVLGRFHPDEAQEAEIARILSGFGLTELVTHTLGNPVWWKPWGVRTGEWIEAKNPLSEDQKGLRTTMLPGMMQVVARNFSFKNRDLYLYEIGKVFQVSEGRRDERRSLGLVLTGSQIERRHDAHLADFLTLKGVLEGLFRALGLGLELRPGDAFFLHPGRRASIFVQGEALGVAGELHPDLVEIYDLHQPAVVCELDLDLLCKRIPGARRHVPLPRYPQVLRDMALVVRDDCPVGAVLRVIEEAGGELVENVSLFDHYKGPQVPESHKSLAFSVAFRSKERTLTDDEVGRLMEGICQSLAKKVEAAIRR